MDRVNITKTYLPSKEKYKEYVDEIYQNNWITNNGPLVQRLENRLADYLGVKNIVLVSSGTTALEIAYRTLDLKGFVVTTPFSFVATASSLVTNSLLPIFADIDKNTLNINENNIENYITKNTSALLPVHVFGNPCDVETIDSIAEKNGLKVVYDASHAFGVKYKEISVLSYGDISTLSFHATKLFHTIEGGALIINDDALVEKARYLINFGIKDPETIPELGTNAKMNEFEAAMGLCVLDDIEMIIERRKAVYNRYYISLKKLAFIPEPKDDTTRNYSYFPIVFNDEQQRIRIQKALNKHNVFPRRYFFPSLDTLDYIEPKQFASVSRDISTRILCLPMYPDLEIENQEKIITIIKTSL